MCFQWQKRTDPVLPTGKLLEHLKYVFLYWILWVQRTNEGVR
jgi:hypothetical protein